MNDIITVSSETGIVQVLGIKLGETAEGVKQSLLCQKLSVEEGYDHNKNLISIVTIVEVKHISKLRINFCITENILRFLIITEAEYHKERNEKCQNWVKEIFNNFTILSQEEDDIQLINHFHSIKTTWFSDRNGYRFYLWIGGQHYVSNLNQLKIKGGTLKKQSQRNAFLEKCVKYKPNIKTIVCTILIILMSFFIPIKGCEDNKKAEDVNYVYVCTGAYSKRYHSASNCKWLGSCKGIIVAIPIDEAEQKGLTPCKSCSKDQILK